MKQKVRLILGGVLLLLLAAGVLFQFHREKELAGTVTGWEGDLFQLRTEDGEVYSVQLAAETSVLDSLGEGDRAFAIGQGVGDTVTVIYRGGSDPIQPDLIWVRQAKTGETVTLSDGSLVEIWQSSDTDWTYATQDGVQLLTLSWDKTLLGLPEGISAQAEEAVSAYFQALPLAADLNDVLETAYASWQGEQDRSFRPFRLTQEYLCSGQSEALLYCTYSFSLADQEGNGQLDTATLFFDRETGALCPLEELLTCTPQEAVVQFLDLGQITQEPLRTQAEEGWQEAVFQLSPDGLELIYPQGSLEAQEFTWSLGLDWTEETEALFQEWALPEDPA